MANQLLMFQYLRIAFPCLILTLFGLDSMGVGQEIDFNVQIRPILSNKCYACHGPDAETREAGLRLDTYEGATDYAIDLDDPAQSELIFRIASDDEDEIMPPPSHGKPLTKSEIELFKRWIEQGAKYAKHWAYQQPQKAELPESNDSFCQNEIDHFVLEKLKASGLSPANQADKYSLIRRLSLDLTGLPPSMEQVEQFVANDDPSAYEKLVDRYLAQPTYGERWASVWLDLARYADSAGYADDRKRTIWAYRDYVVRAYNDNRTFDQFTLEQLAGDLLPNSSEESLIATAFHRNTLTNSEGGTSDEEFRNAAIVDRVNTTMAVWMGTTMACAQCHTHKYDPITQKEYFQFFDILNQTEDADRPNESPIHSIFSADRVAQKQQLQMQIDELENSKTDSIDEEKFAQWKQRLSGKQSEVVGRFVRVDLPGNNRILSVAELEVFSESESGNETNVALKGKATQSSTAYSGPAKYANDGNKNGDHSKKSVTHTATESNPWLLIDLNDEVKINRLGIYHRTDGNLFTRSDGYQISILDKDQKVVWSQTVAKATNQGEVYKIQSAPTNILELVKNENLDEEQRTQLTEYYKSQRVIEINAKISQVQNQLNRIRPTTTLPIMKELAAASRRKTYVQIRGNYMDTGEQVQAGTPGVFHPFESKNKDRLALAKWLVDRKNPLTARVLVNRYWEQLFGIGIVSTSEEFGSQGELPSHAKMLDWLAVDLMENGWDTKRLLKQIVMSGTYRQSSKVSEDLLKRDPANRLLARGPRVRLTAEMIRDQALFASGLLSLKMYGPPVQPPQPKVGLKPAFSGQTTNWKDSVGEDRYRRGIYTEWRRSAPYPSMATFDVNSREVCEIRRTTTNTPLQALVTLNDPVYVEAAQGLARRVMLERSTATLEQKLTFAFQACLVRKPNQKEIASLTRLYESTLAHFRDRKADAEQLATDPLNPVDAQVDRIELATWTTLSNVLLNLDEMFLKP